MNCRQPYRVLWGRNVGFWLQTAVALAATFTPVPAFAAAQKVLDGSSLGWVWLLPFCGLLLSIAVMPLAMPGLWHHHFGKISAAWAASMVVPLLLTQNFGVVLTSLGSVLLLEYIPFIILLASLFVVTGGIYIKGAPHGSAVVNTALLGIGTILASIMGTTGASMLMIRPIIAANLHRKNSSHVIVFFIFLVSNIGGCLTPIGDPPLFIGYLLGVRFFWTLENLYMQTIFVSVVLLVLFFVIDQVRFRRDGVPTLETRRSAAEQIGIGGIYNLALLAALIGTVILRGVWKSEVALSIGPISLPINALVSNILMIAIAMVSHRVTSSEARRRNSFSWLPLVEVAKLFLFIFITMIPVIAIFHAGIDGVFGPLISIVNKGGMPIDYMYFWLTGIMSSVLDNAPTYIVFFHMAGGDAELLMDKFPRTLAAISTGAVFMGALTYIGNAPNFMIRSIAVERGIKVPTFFGYIIWSVGILVPLFLVVTLIFYR